jgi:outer membrane protein assembly factor BamB
LPAETGNVAQPMRGCPAVDAQGRIFVCIQNRLLCFPPDESRPQWEYTTTGAIPRSPTIGPDGHARVHSCDGFLHVIDSAGQRVFDPLAVDEPLGWAMPLIDAENNTWICRREGGLMKIDSSGQTSARPFLRTRRRFDCTGLILDDRLFIGGEDHYLHAIRISGDCGEDLWETTPQCGRTGCPIHAAVALAAGPEFLVASQDGYLYAFGPDGREHWKMALPGQAIGSPVVDADGTIYMGISQNPRNQAGHGVMLAIDPVSHQLRWSYSTAAPVESTPAIGDDGMIYFGDNGGTVHAVDRRGTSVWKAEFAAPIRSAAAILGPGLVALGLDDGSLAVLKCSSQRLLPAGWPKIAGTSAHSGVSV